MTGTAYISGMVVTLIVFIVAGAWCKVFSQLDGGSGFALFVFLTFGTMFWPVLVLIVLFGVALAAICAVGFLLESIFDSWR